MNIELSTFFPPRPKLIYDSDHFYRYVIVTISACKLHFEIVLYDW